jgi:hypothetical protein
MNRVLERVWYDTAVPVFLERFVLPLLATTLIGVIVINPLKFDGTQQVTLAIAIVALAFFVGHTVHKTNKQATVKEPVIQTPPSRSATTSGDDSPANTGDGNTFVYGDPPIAKKSVRDHKK